MEICVFQIDTYESGRSNVLSDRSFLQIKTFCDKGAERKAREEEKRLHKHQRDANLAGYAVSNKSRFQKAYDLVTDPVLFTPEMVANQKLSDINTAVAVQSSARTEVPKANKEKLPQTSYSPCPRVLVYARQENETVYTPFHIVPPTVQGLIRAVSSKYEIDSVDIRFVFRQTSKGILVKVDDDMIKYYCNGDVFIMRVLATEDTENSHVFYDVVFLEEDVANSIQLKEEQQEVQSAQNSQT